MKIMLIVLISTVMTWGADMNTSKSKKGKKVYPRGIIQTH